MTANEILVSVRTNIDSSNRGYIFFRLTEALTVDWMYRYATGDLIHPFSPFYVEDSDGNPFVYLFLNNFVFENDSNNLIF